MKNPNISFYTGNITNTTPTKDLPIGYFLNQIKHGEFKEASEIIAGIEDPEKRRAKKSEILPYVTISGTFTKRNTGGLNQYSGLIALDIDKLKDAEEVEQLREAVSKDPYTYAAFKSVSGLGLCVVFRTSDDHENHLFHYLWAEKYFDEKFGYQIDEACKDVARPRFVSYDENIFINPKISKITGKLKPKKTKPKEINIAANPDKIGRLVSLIQEGGHNIAESYEDYTAVGFALANGCGEGGRDYFHIVCQMSAKYDAKKVDRKFSNALKTGNGRQGIGTFFYMVQQTGIELNTPEEKKAFSIAVQAKRGKSDVRGAIQTAKSMGVDPVIMEQVAEQVFANDNLNIQDDDTPIIEQEIAFVEMNSEVIFNTISQNYEEADGEPCEEKFYNSLYLKARLAIGDKVRANDINAIVRSDQTKDVNPIELWYEAHKNLPSKPEIIDELIDILPLVDPRVKIFIRRWLLGLPATYKGETVRLVLSLISTLQESGKTEWFRKLLPDSLQRYFGENKLMDEKDAALVMSTMWIVLDDEMGGKSKKDYLAFKEITSKDKFTLRKPYGKGVVTMPRLALLAGSSNEHDLIVDKTGNTRILPIDLGDKVYNFKKHNEIDKDQLLMELFRAHEGGEGWKLSPEEKELLNEINCDFTQNNHEEGVLDIYLKKPEGERDILYWSITQIKIHIEEMSNQKNLNQKNLSFFIKQKFKKVNKRIGGSPRIVFEVAKVGLESQNSELQDNQYQRADNQVFAGDPPF